MLFSTKTSSLRFSQFLSELGNLINVKQCCKSYYLGGLPQTGRDGLYGMVWRDNLSQVFFHVNTLMQHIDVNAALLAKYDNSEEGKLISQFPQSNPDSSIVPPELTEELIRLKIKKHINGDNVVILWNENEQDIPEEFMKSLNVKTYIIIKPLITNYCKLTTINVYLKNILKQLDERRQFYNEDK